MSRRYYGPLYLIGRGGPSDPEAKHEGVLRTHRDGISHIDVAKELWSLSGDEARVEAIARVIRRAFGRDDPVLHAADIEELLALIDGNGLEKALKRTIVDDKLIIRPEKLPEVRQRTQLLDVDEARGYLAEVGVMEGLGRVFEAERIFKEARDRQLDVALD